MFGFDGEYPAGHPKSTFWRFSVKNHKKLAVKHSVEKYVLLIFVNLSTHFIQDWSWEKVLLLVSPKPADFLFLTGLQKYNFLKQKCILRP